MTIGSKRGRQRSYWISYWLPMVTKQNNGSKWQPLHCWPSSASLWGLSLSLLKAFLSFSLRISGQWFLWTIAMKMKNTRQTLGKKKQMLEGEPLMPHDTTSLPEGMQKIPTVQKLYLVHSQEYTLGQIPARLWSEEDAPVLWTVTTTGWALQWRQAAATAF